MNRLLAALGVGLVSYIPVQAQILQAEYFFDTDPGVGNGTAIPITPGGTVSAALTIDVPSLGTGFHGWYVRTRQDGVWGHYSLKRVFFVGGGSGVATAEPIDAAEYFFDTDPGAGSGAAIPITPSGTVSETFVIDVSALGTGFHGWYVRTRQDGVWGHYSLKRVFYINGLGTIAPVPVDRVEGFVQADPGVLGGTVIDIDPGSSVGGLVEIPIGMLNPGAQKIYLRVLDLNGTPSHYMVANFSVCADPSEVPAITVVPSVVCTGNTFQVVVTMPSGWTGPDFHVVNDQNAQSATLGSSGTYTFGPFAGGSTIQFTASSTADPEACPVRHTVSRTCYDCPDLLVNNGDACETGGLAGEYEECVCVAYPVDCFGVPNGNALEDACGVCFENATDPGWNISCLDCAGVLNGEGEVDDCLDCRALGQLDPNWNDDCADCAGVPYGSYEIDACGNCRDPSDELFAYDVTSLDYSTSSGFTNAVISPLEGSPADVYTVEVTYFNNGNVLPPPSLGPPTAIFDHSGSGVSNVLLDRSVWLSPTDVSDTITADGKTYRGTVNGLAAGEDWTVRFQVQLPGCLTEFGPFQVPDVRVVPDLQIFANDILFSNDFPDVNTDLTVSATVHNVEDIAVGPFSVRLINQYEPDTVYPDVVVNGMAAQSSTILTWNITTPVVPAWCPVQIVVDVGDDVVETNSLNNSAVRPFVNGPYNVPGSIEVTATTSPSNSYFHPSSVHTVTVSGNATYIGTALDDASVAGATVTLLLPPPQNGTVITYTNSAGFYSATIPALNITDTHSVKVSVTDFTLLSAEVTTQYSREPDPSNCVPWNIDVVIDQPYILVGVSITGAITIYNQNCETDSTQLLVTQTGGTSLVYDPIVPPLVAYEPHTVDLDGIVFNTVGPHTICGTADNTGVMGDAWRKTDCASIQVYPNLPDLLPFSVTGSGYACAGIPIVVTVKNAGAVAAAQFDCDVEILLDGFSQGTYTETIDSLGPFGSVPITIPSNFAPTAPGSYEVIVTVDPPTLNPPTPGAVSESDELNNSHTYQLVLNPCLPDLGVFLPCDGTAVDPADPDLSAPVTYTAQIFNGGNADAVGPILVRFTVGQDIHDVQYQGTLSPGGSDTVSVEVTNPGAALAVLHVEVDPANAITELPYVSDQTSGFLCHEPYPVADNCGSFLPWSWNPTSLGQSSPVRVGVRNSGLFSVDSMTVRFEVSGPEPPGTVLLGVVTVNDLGRTCGCPVVVALPTNFPFAYPGEYIFTFTVDADDEVTECNEGNNVLTRTITIGDKPDLRILSQYINPSLLNPDINEDVTFSVTYDNVGISNIGDLFDLKVLVDEEELAVLEVPGLPGGANNTVDVGVPWSSDLAGVHVVRAIVDPSPGIVTESNENNNEATRSIMVGDAANLYFVSLTTSQSAPSVGSSIMIQAMIGNNGILPVDATVLFFYINAAQNEVLLAHRQISVGVNGNVSLQVLWQVQLNPTDIVARIINASEIEYNLDDNEATTAIRPITMTFSSTPYCVGNGALGMISATAAGGFPITEWNVVDPNGVIFSSSSLQGSAGEYVFTATDTQGNTVTYSGVIEEDLTCDCNGISDGGDLPGVPCDDNDPLTGQDTYQLNCECAGEPLEHVKLNVKVILDGPYVEADQLMRDALRALPGFPVVQPYSMSPFLYSGSESLLPGVLDVSGPDAVVDWILVELRSHADPTQVLALRAGLLQRDGDIVEADGITPLRYIGVPPGTYHVAVRHRNHLGVMTASAIPLSTLATTVDLSSPATFTYGVDARKEVDGKRALWAGNVKPDNLVKYLGANDDRDPVLAAIGGTILNAVVNVYNNADVNMNGEVKYLGSNDDRDPILSTIGGTILNTVRMEQLP